MSWSCFDIFPHFEGDSDFGSTLNRGAMDLGRDTLLAVQQSKEQNKQKDAKRV